MTKKLRADGFSAVGIMVAVLVIAVIGLGGWRIWHNNKDSELDSKSNTTTSQTKKTNTQQNQTTNPSEEGKYLVIKEWGVRAALPSDLKGLVTYSLGEVVSDPDGNQIQAAKILIASNALATNDCAVTSTSIGSSVESGGQYIRSETSKPFNASRYKWTFKENLLQDGGYAYHLNYVTSICAGEGANSSKIEALHNALVQLRKID